MRTQSTPLAAAIPATLARLAVLGGALLALLLLAADADGRTRWVKAQPPLSGIYESCRMPDSGQGEPRSCEQRLRMIREGGFRLVLNYNTASMSVEDNLAYAELARSNGLKLAWNLASYRMPIEPKLDLVRATQAHPATWGYYIGDEVRPENRAEVEALAAAVRRLTGKPLLYISRPRPDLLQPFKAVGDFVGPDSYPVGPYDPPVCDTARWARRMVEGDPRRNRRAWAKRMRSWRKRARAHRRRGHRGPARPRRRQGPRLAMVVQAFSWSVDFPEAQHPWPDAAQMRQMRDAAIRCGRPKVLLWFCFHCITGYHPDPESYWREVTDAAGAPMPRVRVPVRPARRSRR